MAASSLQSPGYGTRGSPPVAILWARKRGFSAARPLGAEIEGTATESPAQPAPPRNTEDPCDPAATGPAPVAPSPPCWLQTGPTGSAGAQTAASAGKTRRGRGAGTTRWGAGRGFSRPPAWGCSEGWLQASTEILETDLEITNTRTRSMGQQEGGLLHSYSMSKPDPAPSQARSSFAHSPPCSGQSMANPSWSSHWKRP